MSTGHEGTKAGDTEVAAPSPADDEQQTPGAAASQEADAEEEPSAPEPGVAEPIVKPDVKYQG
jgi:hypothetical protein